MVTILISPALIGAALIGGELLISMWIPKGAALIRGRRFFETPCLLQEIRYLFFTAMKIHTMARIVKKQINFIFVQYLRKLVRCVSPLLSGME